jgi:MFS family permease
MTRVESGLLGPLQGWLTDRFGPRIVLQVGNLIFGIGLLLFSQMNSILSFYLTFAVMAIGASLGGFATLMVSLVHWFSRHRSKAIAGSQFGYALGGMLVWVMVASLEAYGWRATAAGSGILIIAICMPLSALIRHRPEEIGEQMDGGPAPLIAPASHAAATDSMPTGSSRDFTAGEALHTSAFWLLSFGHAFALLTVSSVMIHTIPHLVASLDFSLVQAGQIVALLTGFQVVGQLIGGYLGDRYDKRYICIVCMAGHTTALFLLAYAEGLLMVLAFAIIHGVSWGARGPMMVALRADYFGASAFGTIMGFSSLIVMLGMSGGPLAGGFMRDHYGSYGPGFAILATVALLGAACFYFATPPTRPQTSV